MYENFHILIQDIVVNAFELYRNLKLLSSLMVITMTVFTVKK